MVFTFALPGRSLKSPPPVEASLPVSPPTSPTPAQTTPTPSLRLPWSPSRSAPRPPSTGFLAFPSPPPRRGSEPLSPSPKHVSVGAFSPASPAARASIAHVGGRSPATPLTPESEGVVTPPEAARVRRGSRLPEVLSIGRGERRRSKSVSSPGSKVAGVFEGLPSPPATELAPRGAVPALSDALTGSPVGRASHQASQPAPEAEADLPPTVNTLPPPRPARRRSPPTPAPTPAPPTPPTPAPRSLGSSPGTPSAGADLLIPQPSYARSVSPSGESVLTIRAASSPRSPKHRPAEIDLSSAGFASAQTAGSALQAQLQLASPQPQAQTQGTLASSLESGLSALVLSGKKRDSAQRRLGALRDLVEDLDFGRPFAWSGAGAGEEMGFCAEPVLGPGEMEEVCGVEQRESFVWAYGGDETWHADDTQSPTAGDSFITSSSSSSGSLMSPPPQPLAYEEVLPTRPVRGGGSRSSRPLAMVEPEFDVFAAGPAWSRPESPAQEVAAVALETVPATISRTFTTRSSSASSRSRSASLGSLAHRFSTTPSIPSSPEPPLPVSTSKLDKLDVDLSPRTHASLRRAARARQAAGTPEPPRPASRVRRERFDVASSGYSKSLEPTSPVFSSETATTTSSDASPTSWRSTLPSSSSPSILASLGTVGIKQQEILWEMYTTEQAFVGCMKHVLRLFAIPLKTPQGKWIEGIPTKVGELFEGLEGVVRVHGELVGAQRGLREAAGAEGVVDVQAFLTALQTWIPKLAHPAQSPHETFLLGFEDVVALVEAEVRDPKSVFGEFVRMQTKAEVLGSMSLGSMLLKPVQRLTKYPLFLKGLIDATPQDDPLRAQIRALLSKTEYIIHTLQAAKAQQEDYRLLQSLSSGLLNLPAGFSLAMRGRKLLGQGAVLRVAPGRDGAPSLGKEGKEARSRSGSLPSQASRMSVSSSISSSAPSIAGSFSPWEASLTPSSRTSAYSVSSFGSFYAPSRSNSLSAEGHHSSPSPAGKHTARPPSGASTYSRPSTPSSALSLGGQSGSKMRKKEDGQTMTMLVFDDVVVLGVVERAGSAVGGVWGKKREKVVRVLEGGVGRVGEVRDLSGSAGGQENLFSLTIIPTHSDNPIPTTWHLALPPSSAHASPNPTLRAKSSSPSLPNLGLGACPQLSSVQAFMSVLAPSLYEGAGEYGWEREEVLNV
ncbi:hypothetical protein IAT38_006225 [Cryptococcus sp. DSM 104549]